MLPFRWGEIPPEYSTDSDSQTSEDDFTDLENGTEIRRGLIILRKLEFRAITAAQMNYALSKSYSNSYTWYSVISSFASGFATLLGSLKWLFAEAINKNGLCETLTAIYNIFRAGNVNTFILIVVPICVGGLIFVFACPKILLPYLKEKEEQHNNAGAAWQALEIKINAFLETTPKGKMSWERIQEAIFEFSKERQEACKNACPDDKTRDRVRNNPLLCAKVVHGRDRAYRKYKKELRRLGERR